MDAPFNRELVLGSATRWGRIMSCLAQISLFTSEKTLEAIESSNFECVADQETAGMTHGRSAKTGSNSRTKTIATPLTGVLKEGKESLRVQVASLAERVAELKERVDRLDGIAPGYYYGKAEHSKRKPGPGKTIDDVELYRSREELVNWLEEVWPEIVRPLLATKDPREMAAIFKKVARPKNLQPPWQRRFLAHPAKLLDFLQSEKFRIKPPRKTVMDALNGRPEDEKRKRAANRLPTRQIANAMAGVPKLKWRTSLDTCSENPSGYVVAFNTDRHYTAMFGVPEPEARRAKD